MLTRGVVNPPPTIRRRNLTLAILLDRLGELLLQHVTLRRIAVWRGFRFWRDLHEEARQKARALRSEVELTLYLIWFIEESCD
jgi:hypothetical protein